MRNFFKTNTKAGAEAYLQKAIQNGTRYAHSIEHVPKVHNRRDQVLKHLPKSIDIKDVKESSAATASTVDAQ